MKRTILLLQNEVLKHVLDLASQLPNLVVMQTLLWNSMVFIIERSTEKVKNDTF